MFLPVPPPCFPCLRIFACGGCEFTSSLRQALDEIAGIVLLFVAILPTVNTLAFKIIASKIADVRISIVVDENADALTYGAMERVDGSVVSVAGRLERFACRR